MFCDCLNSLSFDGIPNFRDLGGIETADGHVVKRGLLFRSGQLTGASYEDIRRLREDLQVKLIIDLRTDGERKLMPNACLQGIAEIWNPLYSDDIKKPEIFRPDETDVLMNRIKSLFILHEGEDFSAEEAVRQVRSMITEEGIDPGYYMGRLYQKFVNNQIVHKQVKQFFSMLINNRGGSILYHCATGKDRTGILTALLLYALGVSKESIICNYMEAAESSEDAVNFLIERLFPQTCDNYKVYRALAAVFFGSKTCYIREFFDAVERDYVSIDNYLQKAFEVRVDNKVRLKTLYLA